MAGKHYSSQNRSSSNHEYNREYIFCEYFLKRQVLNLATSKVIFDLFIRTFFNYLSFNKTQVHLMWLYIHIMYIHIIQLLCLPSKELESCSFTSHRSCCLSVSVCECAGGHTRHVHLILVQCWPIFCDVDPSLAQYWVTVSYLAPR